MIIQKNVKGLERMEVLITTPMKVSLVNKYNSYKQTAWNAKVARNIYEKTEERCI